MARQLRVVGKHGAAADLAIMRNMHIGHDPVVVAEAGDPDILRGAGVEAAEFTNRVAVADLQAGRLAAILLVLRHFAQRTERVDAVVATDARPPGDHHVRADQRIVANFHLLADDRISPDGHVLAESGARMDDCTCMDHGYSIPDLRRYCSWRTSARPRPRFLHRPKPPLRSARYCETGAESEHAGATGRRRSPSS